MLMATIVILGAGLTGLSTAYHLEKAGFYDYKLFEKEPTTGGLCRSIKQDGFTFDYTGHLLHVNDPYFKSLLAELIGPEALGTINRRSYVYSHDTYTHYPYQMNLYGLPDQVIADCVEGYVLRKENKKPKSFLDWVMSSFGEGFARHFFIPYQSKIFAHDITKISASWTGRFVPQTSLQDIIKGALHPKSPDPVGYNAQFFYPVAGGIQFWVDGLARKLHNKIYTDYQVISVDAQKKVVSFADGSEEPYDILVSTMPLDYLIKNIKEPATSNLRPARNKLLCNGVVNFNLGIEGELTDKHWIYFPEDQYPFYRLGFPHNFSDTMAPKGHSSLYGEFAYMPGAKNKKESLSRSIAQTKKLFNLNDERIVTTAVLDIAHAYVLYTFWREKHLTGLLQHLQNMSIYSIGRYGAWKYASMQEGVLDGKHTAEQLLTQLPLTSNWNLTYASRV